MNYNIEDIYVKFRKAQSFYNNRPYRIPKDVSTFLEKNLSEKNMENIKNLTNALNTRWQNIDIDRYLEYGFELFGKNFSYTKFFDSRLIEFYIMKDRNMKRDTQLVKDTLDKSIRYVKSVTREKDDKEAFIKYANLKQGFESVAVADYIKGYIDRYFLTWLVYKGYLSLTDDDRDRLPLIVENYRNYVYELRKAKLLDMT